MSVGIVHILSGRYNIVFAHPLCERGDACPFSPFIRQSYSYRRTDSHACSGIPFYGYRTFAYGKCRIISPGPLYIGMQKNNGALPVFSYSMYSSSCSSFLLLILVTFCRGWEGHNRNFLSICHSEHREESGNSCFMCTDPSLRSGWHDILIVISCFDTLSRQL